MAQRRAAHGRAGRQDGGRRPHDRGHHRGPAGALLLSIERSFAEHGRRAAVANLLNAPGAWIADLMLSLGGPASSLRARHADRRRPAPGARGGGGALGALARHPVLRHDPDRHGGDAAARRRGARAAGRLGRPRRLRARQGHRRGAFLRAGCGTPRRRRGWRSPRCSASAALRCSSGVLELTTEERGWLRGRRRPSRPPSASRCPPGRCAAARARRQVSTRRTRIGRRPRHRRPCASPSSPSRRRAPARSPRPPQRPDGRGSLDLRDTYKLAGWTCSRPCRHRRGRRSTRPRWSAMPACWRRCSRISTSRARSREVRPGRS